SRPSIQLVGCHRYSVRSADRGDVRRRTAAAAVAVLALACAGGSAYALRVPAAPKCAVFPKTNPWNQRVDRLPVAANSAAIIGSRRPPPPPDARRASLAPGRQL